MTAFLALIQPAAYSPPPPPPPGTDTTAPSIPIGMSVVSSSATQVVLQGFTPSDPSPPGSGSWTGLGSNALDIIRTPPGLVIGSVLKSSLTGSDSQPLLTLSDIGGPLTPSTLVQSGADITISTVGDVIWGTADQFAYAHQAISGTVQAVIIFSLPAWTSVTAWAKAQAQFRQSLAAGSPYVATLAFPFPPGNGWALENRATLNGSATQPGIAANSSASKIILVQSVGGTYHAYYSLDGNTLISLGSVTQAMGSSIFAGVALTSGTVTPGPSVSCTFSQLSIQTLSNWTYTDGTVVSGSSYTYQAKARDAASPPNVSAPGSAISALAVTTPSGGATASPQYGTYNIGGQNNYGSAACIQLFSICLVNVYTTWDGFGNFGGAGTTPASICAAVKAINPNSLMVPYMEPWVQGTSGSANLSVRNAATAGNWYLRAPYPGGAIQVVNGNDAMDVMAGGSTVTTGGVARDWLKFCPDWTKDYAQSGGSAGLTSNANTPNPNSIGGMMDDVFALTQLTADARRLGSNQTAGDTTASQLMRQAYVLIAGRIASNNPPGAPVMANLSQFASPGAPFAEYQNVWNGGVGEGNLGYFWSTENFNTFAVFLSLLRTMGSALAAPGYYIFAHGNLTTSGADPSAFSGSTPTSFYPNWTSARYGFCSCYALCPAQTPLYFPWLSSQGGTNAPSSAAQIPWWDEMALNSSTNAPYAFDGTRSSIAAGLGYLGIPDGPAPASPLADGSGCYGRTFTNSITGKRYLLLVNPKGGNASAVVQVLTLYGLHAKAFNGTQDSATNNGATTSTVSFSHARDGRVVQLV